MLPLIETPDNVSDLEVRIAAAHESPAFAAFMSDVTRNELDAVDVGEPVEHQPDPEPIDLRTPYSVVDACTGTTRGTLRLSELEAEVLKRTLAKGDLMIAKLCLVAADVTEQSSEPQPGPWEKLGFSRFADKHYEQV